MRIKQCAELTGTTVRTIRYYHQVGLVPVPEERRGRRDYGLEHVARVLRVRWLAEAGLGLSAIGELLAAEDRADTRAGADARAGAGEQPGLPSDDSTLRDLRATAAALGEQISRLQEQQRRIATLVSMAERGEELTALPLPVHDFYSRVAAATTDPRALQVLRRERDLAELVALRGGLPAAFSELLAEMDDAAIDRIVSFYVRFAALADDGVAAGDGGDGADVDDVGDGGGMGGGGGVDDLDDDRQLDAIVEDLEHWWTVEEPDLVLAFLDRMPAWLRRPGSLDVLGRLAAHAYDHPRQRELIRRAMPPFIRHVQDHAGGNPR